MKLQNGTEIPCELAVVAIGVRPNVKLAREAGIKIGELGGIAVDEFMQTSEEGIYAAGDCVEVTNRITNKKVLVDIKEIKRPDRDAQLVAENIASQLENRVSFRRAMKSTMSRTMKSGALGIKTAVAGRLGGADMARTEFYSEGTIPLQTLRADIDYGFAEADTTYGKLGVKVWIYKGEVLPTKGNAEGRSSSKEGSDK